MAINDCELFCSRHCAGVILVYAITNQSSKFGGILLRTSGDIASFLLVNHRDHKTKTSKNKAELL